MDDCFTLQVCPACQGRAGIGGYTMVIVSLYMGTLYAREYVRRCHACNGMGVIGFYGYSEGAEEHAPASLLPDALNELDNIADWFSIEDVYRSMGIF